MTLRSKQARCRILKTQLQGSVRYVTTAGAGAASAHVTPDTSCTHPFINRGLCGGNPDGGMRISWPVQLHLKDTKAHIHTSVTLPYSLLPGHRPQLLKMILKVHAIAISRSHLQHRRFLLTDQHTDIWIAQVSAVYLPVAAPGVNVRKGLVDLQRPDALVMNAVRGDTPLLTQRPQPDRPVRTPWKTLNKQKRERKLDYRTVI